MAYDLNLANKVREYLTEATALEVQEKTMFGGIAFLVDGKMCVNVSGEHLMCRIDPKQADQLNKRSGVEPMVMRGRKLDGYCLVNFDGYKDKKDLEFWIDACLKFNHLAERSKKK
ncbi:TfoX/Sxy family protein [Sphingobacterium endophyticum]|uniref:TfoX/Sxy family protein n=1 Tax=Sphingobacterium endophyticum TaxID=2546448 RepID=UPI0012E2E695|nr:TfoX/Sxy family protein [Sphingobacterium endophyticum]